MSDLILADVSRHQGPIDWAAYARFSPAAICKATGGDHDSGGTSRVDPRFYENRVGMRAHLDVRGFYHFLQLNADPVAQARHFAKTLAVLRPGEFAVLDVEQDNHVARHRAFCDETDRLLGGVCWLYGGRDVDNPQGRPYWVARYPASHEPDPAKEPSLPHVLWQFTDRGRAPGIAGGVDLNVHRGDLASLARFAIRAEEDEVALDDADVERIVDRWQAKYGERLAQWIAGKPNSVYASGTLDGAPTPGSSLAAKIDALAASGGGSTTDASGEYEIVVRRKT